MGSTITVVELQIVMLLHLLISKLKEFCLSGKNIKIPYLLFKKNLGKIFGMSSKLHQSSRVLNLCRACHPLLYVSYISVHPKYMPYFAQQIQLPWCHSHSQPACCSLGCINESSLQTTQQRKQKCHLNPWPWRWNGSQYLTCIHTAWEPTVASPQRT